MTLGPQLLLICAVAAVGVLHTIVPDHWAPIALIARQRSWSKAETARASFQAGVGHVLSTLLIAAIVWLAGVAVATRFGHFVDLAASIALVGLGGWIAISAWRELHRQTGHGHSHCHSHSHSHSHAHTHAFDQPGVAQLHGPELQRIPTARGELQLSIYEAGGRPRFRATGIACAAIRIETVRADGTRQLFGFRDQGTCLESIEEIPEPHEFQAKVTVEHSGRTDVFETRFVEEYGYEGSDHDGYAHAARSHDMEPADDPLYAPLRDTAVMVRHSHAHRHGRGPAHAHKHDHVPQTVHSVAADIDAAPPPHEHLHKTSARTALLLVLGSSPMVEGIPAFFAASNYGIGLIIVMSIVFAISTIATYVLLCVYSTVGLQGIHLGAFERYGEVLSGAFIALVGVVFWVWPAL